MSGFKLMNRQEYFDLINNSTLISNVNSGTTVTTDYFGTKTVQGMAYNLGSLYNKAQSNYMTPNKAKL